MSKVLMQSLTLTATPLNPKPLNPCAFLRRADGSVVADHISTRLTMRPWFWGDFQRGAAVSYGQTLEPEALTQTGGEAHHMQEFQ